MTKPPRYDDGLFVTDDRVRKAARDLPATSAAVNPPSIEEAYVLPQFGDWPFAFIQVDAVYVWTQGGYQVGREPDDYPLFLAVLEKDVDAWQRFFEQFGIPIGFERRPEDSFEDPLQVVLDERSVLDPDHVEGYPVISRRETIAYAGALCDVSVGTRYARSHVRRSRSRRFLPGVRERMVVSFTGPIELLTSATVRFL